MVRKAKGAGCPLSRRSTYGCEALGAMLARPARIALLAALSSAAAGAVMAWLYTKTGDQSLLLGALIIGGMAPLDAGLVYGLMRSAALRSLRLVDKAARALEPEAYGVASRLGTLYISALLRDGRLAVIVYDSRYLYAIVFGGYTVLGARQGKPPLLTFEKLLGLRRALRLSLGRLRRQARLRGCMVISEPLGPRAELELPDPSAPRVIRVRGEGRLLVVDCGWSKPPLEGLGLLLARLGAGWSASSTL